MSDGSVPDTSSTYISQCSICWLNSHPSPSLGITDSESWPAGSCCEDGLLRVRHSDHGRARDYSQSPGTSGAGFRGCQGALCGCDGSCGAGTASSCWRQKGGELMPPVCLVFLPADDIVTGNAGSKTGGRGRQFASCLDPDKSALTGQRCFASCRHQISAAFCLSLPCKSS